MPADTYAYTTKTPHIMQFGKEVSFDSFWLRLHRSSKAYIERAEGTRVVQVYLNNRIVAESVFMLRSDEWMMIKPDVSTGAVIGDTLLIQENTDIDSIVVSFGDTVKENPRIFRRDGNHSVILGKFTTWKVVETPKDKTYNYKM